MTYPVGNQAEVEFTYSVDSSSNSIELIYDNDPLTPYGHRVFVELIDPNPDDSIEPSTTFVIHDRATADVYAWEQTPSGLVAWARSANGSSCYQSHTNVDTEVLVVHVPPGVSVPTPTSTNGPPAPGTSQTVLHVKVKKQGDQPFD